MSFWGGLKNGLASGLSPAREEGGCPYASLDGLDARAHTELKS